MKTFLNFRNNLTMLYKNLPENDLRHVMRIRFWLDYVAAFKSLLLDRNWGEFRAVLRGRKAYKAWRADFADDRRRIQASRIDRTDPEVADLLPRASYSILWQYYVKGNCMYKYLKKAK